MCGIAGIVSSARRNAQGVDASTVFHALQHRGPDAHGTWSNGAATLYHTRLSVLDVGARSNQPMVDVTNSYVIVYNGEIYNHKELRDRLRYRGYQFRTSGDTEVLLNHLIEFGSDGLADLRGMFSFALYNTQDGSVLIGRDPFGIKPLAYQCSDNNFVFSSTIDGLRLFGGITSLNLAFLRQYLQFGHGVLGETPIEGARRVAPGTCVEYRRGGVRQWRFYDVRKQTCRLPGAGRRMRSGTRVGEERGPGEEFARLNAAIQRHLEADVPVGIFLSGGLDSAAIAATVGGDSRLTHSFSVKFHQPAFDESARAAATARLAGTVHHEIPFNEVQAARLLSTLAKTFDEPIGDAAALPTLEVSRVAAEEVKVALSGEGGDELFGGYRRYWWFPRLRRIPKPARKALARALGAVPGRQRLQRLLDWDRWEVGYARWFEYGVIPVGGENPYTAELASITARSGPNGQMWSLMTLDLMGWLVDSYLTRLDRATMAYSLEGRVPLLDLDILEIATQLTDEDRITRPSLGKRFLQEYVCWKLDGHYMPAPKHGFGVPIVPIVQSEAIRHRLKGLREGVGKFGNSLITLAARLSETSDSGAATRAWYIIVLLEWLRARQLLQELESAEEYIGQEIQCT